MAVVRKLKNTTEDGRGNLIASNSGAPQRTAQQIRTDMNENAARSVMPTGNAQVGVSPQSNIYTPSYVPNQGPTSSPNSSVRINMAATVPRLREGSGYTPSDRVTMYQRRLNDAELGQKPGWSSRYESEIQSILDNIMNRKSFDVRDNANYKQLYDQYAQSYMLQGNRAMRDQLGAAAGLTGGYGSTAAQAAASQAYDNYMQQLNDRNVDLMGLAYQMYADEIADNYNQLGAVTGLDNTDYGRYRDEVGDYYRDLDYLADRYNQELGFDYNQFADDRNYEDSAFQTALSAAMQFANNGMAIPERYASVLDEATLAQLNALAQQAAAQRTASASGGSGGGGGRSGRGSSNGSDEEIDLVDVMNKARNSGATEKELRDIYNDMTQEQKARYNLQLRH